MRGRYTLALGCLVVLISGCTEKRQITTLRPSGYAAPISMAKVAELSWQAKADIAQAVSDAEAKIQQVNPFAPATVQAPRIQKNIFIWAINESKNAARPNIATKATRPKFLSKNKG